MGVAAAIEDTPLEQTKLAAQRGDWKAARRWFEKCSATPNPRPPTLIEAATAVMDWCAVLDAEAQLLRWRDLADVDALPTHFLRASITARIELGLFDDAVRLARARREKKPGQPEWWRLELAARGYLGASEDMLELALTAWRQGHAFGATFVVQNLVSLGRLDQCREFVDQLPAASEKYVFARARVRYLAACPDAAAALDALMALESTLPEKDFTRLFAKQAAQARRADLLDGVLERVEKWASDAEQLPTFLDAAPGILFNDYSCTSNYRRIEPFVEPLMAACLAPASAKSLCRTLVRNGDLGAAKIVGGRTLEVFPSAIAIWEQMRTLAAVAGDADEKARLRDAMRARFPLASYLTTTSASAACNWDLEDVGDLLRHNLELGDPANRAKFLSALGETHLEAEHVAKLRQVAVDAPPLVRGQVELIVASLVDASMLARASQTPMPYASFLTRPAVVADMARATTAILSDRGSDPLADGHGMPEVLRHLELMAGDDREMYIYTRECYAEAVSLSTILIDRIRNGSPTSLIRIGDGEGQFLPGHPSTLAYREADQSEMQDRWFGSTSGRRGVFAKMESDLRIAIDNSDMIGLLPHWRALSLMGWQNLSANHRGVLNANKYFADLPNRNKIYTSAHFPHDLHKWNLWNETLSATESASIISCHDLRPYLQEAFGVSVGVAMKIPGEHEFRSLFGRADEDAAKEVTLLDLHEEVCAGLAPRPGEVYLVAAGFLGKIYCGIIKERGGIAIDIGSLADYWMGFATRRYRLEQFNSYALPGLMISGHPLGGVERRERVIGRAAVVRSSTDCRYNIAGEADVAEVRLAPRERRFLRVVGHPRCASGYMATVFAQNGVLIGHEKLLAHGISSWMLSVADLHVPSGQETGLGVEFAHTIAYVRDPIEAIPSIILENTSAPSFNFRRLHILRNTGVDLAGFMTAIDRAVASLVYWYEIVDELQPELVIRIEEAEQAVDDFLRGVADRPEWTEGDRKRLLNDTRDTRPPPIDAGGGKLPYNSSLRKFGRQKDPLRAADCRSLDGSLANKLRHHCERFGYGVPFDGDGHGG